MRKRARCAAAPARRPVVRAVPRGATRGAARVLVRDRAPNGGYVAGFTLDQYLAIGTRITPLINTIWYASLGTIACLVVAYPLAYYLATRAGERRYILLALVVIPLWTSFLIRTYAWMFILGSNGVPKIWDELGLGAGPAPEHALRDHPGHRLQLPAAHDPAPVRQPRPARPVAARGVAGPGRGTLRDLPPDHPAAVAARDRDAVACWCSSRPWASTSSPCSWVAARPTSWATPSQTCSCSRATGPSVRPSASAFVAMMLVVVPGLYTLFTARLARHRPDVRLL